MFVKARLLDGGFASTMQLLGKEVDGDPLWTSRCLQTDPETIVKVHSAFLHAGAEILITASYQASIDGFCTHLKISREQSIQLIKDSVTLAKVAVSNFDRPDRDILVAGSIGPYGACLADGSEYSGSYVQHLTEQELMDWHQPRLEALLDAGVDLLALETIPALAEALALLKLLKKYPSAKAWVSFSCKDGTFTNFGDDFGNAAKACFVENPDQLVGVGVNCTDPAFITSLLTNAERTVSSTALPRVIYPNSGEIWTTEKRWEGNAEDLETVIAREIKKWFQLGVRVIGGCCRVGPSQIKVISELMKG